jgi:DNA-binding FadR family transcriptional regulator
MVSRISTGTVTRSLVEDIGGAIVRGDYVIGHSLPTEAELAAKFNVSRTVTREAIKMLTAKGLVQAWPRRGTIVQKESNWNLLDADVLHWLLDRNVSIPLVKDFLRMRLAVEPAAAELAAVQRADVSEIEQAVVQMRRAAEHGGDALGADSQFHASILRASGNPFFAQMSPMVDTALRMTIRITNRIKGVRFASIQEHVDILEAIRSGDAQQAKELSRSHVERALNLILNNDQKPKA